MAETKTSKHVFTNVSHGPKALNGLVPIVLQAGEATPEPVEITEAELASAKATGWFEVGAAKAEGEHAKRKG